MHNIKKNSNIHNLKKNSNNTNSNENNNRKGSEAVGGGASPKVLMFSHFPMDLIITILTKIINIIYSYQEGPQFRGVAKLFSELVCLIPSTCL